MSRASEWVTTKSGDQPKWDERWDLRLPSDPAAYVDRTGKCIIKQGRMWFLLTPPEALSLALWILDTFGEVPEP